MASKVRVFHRDNVDAMYKNVRFPKEGLNLDTDSELYKDMKVLFDDGIFLSEEVSAEDLQAESKVVEDVKVPEADVVEEAVEEVEVPEVAEAVEEVVDEVKAPEVAEVLEVVEEVVDDPEADANNDSDFDASDVLRGNVNTVKSKVNRVKDKAQLEELLKFEREGKNRSGVVNHLNSCLENL